MTTFENFVYPDEFTDIRDIIKDDKELVIVGVIGKSAFPDCDKMTGFGIIPTTDPYAGSKKEQVTFYYNKSESMLFLQFQTTYDEYCMREAMSKFAEDNQLGSNLIFNKYIRSRFGRMLLFATYVCDLIVYVELSVTFDSSLISIMKALKIVRSKYISMLLENHDTFVEYYPPYPPRLLFFFENYPPDSDKTEDAVSKLEMEVELNINKVFRNELCGSMNSLFNLFTLPEKKHFVYYNCDEKIREDLLIKSMDILKVTLEQNSKDDGMYALEKLRPFDCFGKPFAYCNASQHESTTRAYTFIEFLKDHVRDFLQWREEIYLQYHHKYSDNAHTLKVWFEKFKFFHKFFMEYPGEPDFQPTDVNYKSYLENFERLLDIDKGFFSKCCEMGKKKVNNLYNNNFKKLYYGNLVDEATMLYLAYARGPDLLPKEDLDIDFSRLHMESTPLECDDPSILRAYGRPANVIEFPKSGGKSISAVEGSEIKKTLE